MIRKIGINVRHPCGGCVTVIDVGGITITSGCGSAVNFAGLKTRRISSAAGHPVLVRVIAAATIPMIIIRGGTAWIAEKIIARSLNLGGHCGIRAGGNPIGLVVAEDMYGYKRSHGRSRVNR